MHIFTSYVLTVNKIQQIPSAFSDNINKRNNALEIKLTKLDTGILDSKRFAFLINKSIDEHASLMILYLVGRFYFSFFKNYKIAFA